MEVGDDEVRVGDLPVDWEDRQHDPGDAADHEQRDEADASADRQGDSAEQKRDNSARQGKRDAAEHQERVGHRSQAHEEQQEDQKQTAPLPESEVSQRLAKSLNY